MNRVFDMFTTLNPKINKMDKFIQHGRTSCLLHTLAVAYYSVKLAEMLHIKVHQRELIKGALLHDYFLYDWHKPRKGHNIHGFTHPKTALRNAERDFGLNNLERDIIKKHMFPLTPKPPASREAWLVCCVDKWCSLREAFGYGGYYRLRTELKKRMKGSV